MKNLNWIKILLSIFVLLEFGCSKSNTDTVLVSNLNAENINKTGGTSNLQFSGVEYGVNKDWKGRDISLKLDVYQPPNMQAGKKYPLVMYVHGGSYLTGNKTGTSSECKILSDSGFITVTINYRLGWSDGVNDPCKGDTASLNDASYRGMQDANAALRFLVANANKYNIDTSWIFVSGTSAGACVVLTSSYINDAYAKVRYKKSADKLGGLQNADNNLTNKYTIKGICAIAGALGDSTLINAKQAFPCISFQGELDKVIPVNFGHYNGCKNYPMQFGSLCQYRQLTANHVTAIANILPGVGHESKSDSGYDIPFAMGNAACFFHKLIRKQKTASGIYAGIVNTCSN